MRQQPEKAEQAAIVKLLKLLGASVYVIGTKRRKGDYQGTMQTPGIPDLYAFLPNVRGRADAKSIWIEVKAASKMSPAQEQFERDCWATETPHLVGGLDVVTDWLRQGGWIK